MATFRQLLTAQMIIDTRARVDSVSIAPSVLEAALPPPSAGNRGLMYFISDRRGGVLVYSTGTSYEERSPALNDVAGLATSTWEARGSGEIVGDMLRINNVGNNPCMYYVWNGTYWEVLGGRQLGYRAPARVLGTGPGASSVITLPNFNCLPDILNLYGGVEVRIVALASAAAVAATLLLQWGGADVGGTQSNNRGLRMMRSWRNDGATNLQVLFEKGNDDAGGLSISGSDVSSDKTKDTTDNQLIDGTVTFTHATSIQGRLTKYEIWLTQ